MRQRIGRTVSRARRVVDRFVGGIGRRGLDEVIGEIRERRIRPSLRQTFDRLAHAPVEPDAPRRRQFPVQRLANERVHEAEPAGSVRRFGDQLRLHAFVDGVEQAILRQVAERFEDLDVELAPENGRKAERPIARLAQARQPPADDLLDPFGQAEGRGALAAARPRVKRRERAGLRQVSQHFADEKRIALRAVQPRGA